MTQVPECPTCNWDCHCYRVDLPGHLCKCLHAQEKKKAYDVGLLEGYKHGFAAGEIIGENREREAQIDRDREDRTRGE